MGIAHNRRAVLIRGLDTGLRQSAIFITFALLAVLHTWPLASDPAHLSRNDNADTLLNEWIVAWVGHQAPRQPLKLFEANIFYPEPRTLAYSEYLIVPSALGAPLQAVGASPVLVYNLLLLAGFTLTGWAGWLLIYRWTGDMWAGLVTGIILAFNAHTLTRLPQLQALHMEFLPLALLFLEQLLQAGGTAKGTASGAEGLRYKAILIFAACLALQGTTSYYGLVLTAVALTVSWAVRGEHRHLGGILVAASIALAILMPLYVPYLRLGQVRPLDEVARVLDDGLPVPGALLGGGQRVVVRGPRQRRIEVILGPLDELGRRPQQRRCVLRCRDGGGEIVGVKARLQLADPVPAGGDRPPRIAEARLMSRLVDLRVAERAELRQEAAQHANELPIGVDRVGHKVEARAPRERQRVLGLALRVGKRAALGEEPGDPELPGTGDFPPDRALGVDDPSADVPDDLRTRELRRDVQSDDRSPGFVLVTPEGDDGYSDEEAQEIGDEVDASDADLAAEEAAMHVIDPDGSG